MTSHNASALPPSPSDELATPAADKSPSTEHEHDDLGMYPQLITFTSVVLPFVGLIVALATLWGSYFNWVYLGILVGMYLITGFGITIGYHRLFTHRSFRTPNWVSTVLAIFGSMAVEGPVLHWVAVHRKHHQHSDDHGDPHSPHAFGPGLVGTLKGMWHAHIGWSMLKRQDTDLARYVYDLNKDPSLRFVNRTFNLWVVIGLILPAILGGLLTMSWMGVLLGFIWGGLVRVLLVHHATWSINSVCHLWGTRPFKSNDESRNNVIFGIFSLGEGWHNNHHAFPTSARHGLRWWQIDFSYIVIKTMSMIGLASKVKVPTQEKQDSRRLMAREPMHHA